MWSHVLPGVLSYANCTLFTLIDPLLQHRHAMTHVDTNQRAQVYYRPTQRLYARAYLGT